jgi:hypothetical protein
MDEDTDLADEELETQLVSAARTAVGDSLRSVTYFTPDAYEQVYLRAGLDTDADLAGFVEHESVGFRARTAYRGSELGEYRYTVRAFQNGFLVRVTEDGHGLFFTVDDISLRSAEEAAEAVSRVLDGA